MSIITGSIYGRKEYLMSLVKSVRHYTDGVRTL